ncbi:FAD-binding protein [Saccharopolyspora cebuensis]|uniref:FAD-binding protein n=1 Tax=Saccharopolyspora cebuensis TaxID=418759 RepID=A0ABV4CBM4_9PSEU
MSRNWAGNVTFKAEGSVRPTSVEQVQELVSAAGRVRAVGGGHSFNTIADTPGLHLSVADLPDRIRIDGTTAAVPAGMRYGELAEALHAEGLALHNLASLPHITVAGACATGTHGSGDRNRTLAGVVAGVDLVRADGEFVALRRGDPGFDGAVVSLGALGVVTALLLDVVPAFEVRQHVYTGFPLRRLGEDFDAVFGLAYSVSAFTDWRGPDAAIWVKAHATDDPAAQREWLGATLADAPRHPVPGGLADGCTEQLGVVGAWHARLPHFRGEAVPSTGAELQSEYFVPRAAAPEACARLLALGERIAPVVQISEVRTVAAEELWLSPSRGQDVVGLHFTWHPDPAAVRAVLPEIEAALLPLGARPHWGKVSSIPPDVVRERYPRWSDFAALVAEFDPEGKFRNDLLDAHLGT